jgi:predicted TPR repeat methyltransferase
VAVLAKRDCLVCGRGGPFSKFYSRNGFDLVRCGSCGLVFEDPQPADAVLAKSYYYDADFSTALLGDLRQWTIERATEKLNLLNRLAAPQKSGRALDVGCSSGAWLEVAAVAGWLPTGIELGQNTAAAAQARGLDVRVGTFSDAAPSLAGERFSLITFWDVLEHLRDPRVELALAHRLLAADGLVAATFPNVEGWYPRTTYRLFANRSGVWEYPELPLHLYDFSPSTASRLLTSAGFEVVAVRTFPTPFSHYRGTTLSRQSTGVGKRGWALRMAFELARLAIYPPAQLFNRANSIMVVARPAAKKP